MEVYGIKKWVIELFFLVVVIGIWVMIYGFERFDMGHHLKTFTEMIGR